MYQQCCVPPNSIGEIHYKQNNLGDMFSVNTQKCTDSTIILPFWSFSFLISQGEQVKSRVLLERSVGSSGFLKFTLVGVHQRNEWIKRACFREWNLAGINWKINSSGASVLKCKCQQSAWPINVQVTKNNWNNDFCLSVLFEVETDVFCFNLSLWSKRWLYYVMAIE